MVSDAGLLAQVDAGGDIAVGTAVDGAALGAISWAVHRRATAEAEVAEAVSRARAAGMSWAVIGAALGVSRPGALHRYGR
jgi:hypothetical protein